MKFEVFSYISSEDFGDLWCIPDRYKGTKNSFEKQKNPVSETALED